MSARLDLDLNRRDFIRGGSASLAATFLASQSGSILRAADRKMRIAIVGTGSRGSLTWGRELLKYESDLVEIVGLCDINSKRVRAAQGIIGVTAPTFVDFDTMVRETRPDAVVVTTVDATHYRYTIRAAELGCDVISEKPMCTDEEQCKAILAAEKKTGRKITVTFNARHSDIARKVKAMLLDEAVGEVISVDFHEFLNTSHGADYFRRWHRLRENSGTLLVHKACHHFDQMNWWLDSEPEEVIAEGELRFYGHNNDYRGTHCRGCAYQDECKFYWDVTRNPTYVKLYTDCESEDGYLRDRCVWSEDTNIYDTMSVLVRYANGVRMTYTANCYLPYEGQVISFNGTKGRLDAISYRAGTEQDTEQILLTPVFGERQVITGWQGNQEGGHGGADVRLKEMMFRGTERNSPLALGAGTRAGALASLIGIAARHSIEQDGAKIRISDLVDLG